MQEQDQQEVNVPARGMHDKGGKGGVVPIHKTECIRPAKLRRCAAVLGFLAQLLA